MIVEMSRVENAARLVMADFVTEPIEPKPSTIAGVTLAMALVSIVVIVLAAVSLF